MRKVSTAEVEDQAPRWREGLEAAIRERVREVIEEILHEEVEEALGARRSQRAAGPRFLLPAERRTRCSQPAAPWQGTGRGRPD